MPANKRICEECVTDDYLKRVISQSPDSDEVCDYCGTIAPTIEMDVLATHCNRAIGSFFEASSLYPAVRIYDRTPDGEDLPNLLERIVGAPEDAVNDLIELLTDWWFDFDSQEYQYGEEPWFVEKTYFAEKMSEAWTLMESSMRNQARFINPEASKMLESVFGPVLDDKTHQGKDVVVEIGPTCQINTLFRARVFQTTGALELALSHPERHIGSPPPGIGAAGRMNAKGISVFYGATEKEIALSEVRPMVGCHAAIGQFKIIRKLRLLDLEQLGKISLRSSSSYFDPSTVIEATRRDFLAILSEKMVMPVMPELEEQSYLITQAIADFLATHPKLNLDGIIFPSAQKSMATMKVTGRNVTLFNKASVVLNAEIDYQSKAAVHLWDSDEDGTRFAPEIWVTEQPIDEVTKLPFWVIPATGFPALELDRASIEIRELIEIDYKSNIYPVTLHKMPAKKPKE